ncbi:hypothetical protein [Roseimaritima sediminicola]|uniref:hypothetical protein n=1 Tax=Roseimaritima sediminicola TaxID=2662066 RepID=UPI001298240E|nr:hypothetical protein [Roseimaritima sediminicola]
MWNSLFCYFIEDDMIIPGASVKYCGYVMLAINRMNGANGFRVARVRQSRLIAEAVVDASDIPLANAKGRQPFFLSFSVDRYLQRFGPW